MAAISSWVMEAFSLTSAYGKFDLLHKASDMTMGKHHKSITSHDAWFRAKVREALGDVSPDLEDVDAEKVLAERKRRILRQDEDDDERACGAGRQPSSHFQRRLSETCGTDLDLDSIIREERKLMR